MQAEMAAYAGSSLSRTLSILRQWNSENYKIINRGIFNFVGSVLTMSDNKCLVYLNYVTTASGAIEDYHAVRV